MFATLLRLASLREDYLNQVQRDFLSLSLSAKTPLANALAKKFAITRWILRQTQEFVQVCRRGGVLE